MARSRPARWWAVLLAAALGAGACGTAAEPTLAPSPIATDAAAMATPTPTPTPRPTPTRTPTPTQAPDPTPIPLRAGTYRSTLLEPTISYTLPAGWQLYADTRTWFELVPQGPDNRSINVFVRPKAPKMMTGCVAVADETVGPTASDLLAWLAAHPALEVSKPKAATVAGLPGTVVDVALDYRWTKYCPWHSMGAATSMLLFGDDGSDILPVTSTSHSRLYVADLPTGGTLVIDVDHHNGWDLDSFQAAAQPIVQSIALPDLPRPSPTAIVTGTTGTVTLPEYGFTVTLPKKWKTVVLEGEDLDAVIAAVPEDIVPAEMRDRIAGLMAAGLKLWAFDYDSANAGANMSVMALTTPIPKSLLLLSAKAGVSQIPEAKHIRATEITIDGQPAVRIDLDLAVDINGTKVTMTETQLYIPRPKTTLIVTIATPAKGQLKDRDALVKGIRLD